MPKSILKFAIPVITLVIIMAVIAGCGGTTTLTTTTSAPPSTITSTKTTTTTTATTITTSSTTTTTTTPPPTPPAANEIVIGASRDITGPMAAFQDFGFAAVYKMWAEDVNNAGGINVAGKELPVRILEYDDGSDNAKVAANIEKLCTQDHVNFLFGPTGTTPLFAAAPIANKYKTLLIAGEGGATTLEPKLPDLPYIFSVLNYSNHFQLPVFAQVMQTAGAKTAYICYLENLHGAEYNLVAQTEFGLHNINVVGITSIPIDIADMDPIIKQAQASNADIFCLFAYPPNIILFMQTAIALNYNPNALLLGPGGNFGLMPTIFGVPTIEGCIGEGAWNAKSSASAAAFADKLLAKVGVGNMDWWGALVYYSSLEFFQQSIEKAASLDNDKVRAVMATSHFQTALGDMWWDCAAGGTGGGLLPEECYAGQIGQWQKGIFEVIDEGAKRTAAPVYPKPPWPAAP